MPEFSDMTREAYFAQLDAMTEQVRKEMERMKEIALSESEDVKTPSVRCSIFRNAVLTLEFGYAKESQLENLTLELRECCFATAITHFSQACFALGAARAFPCRCYTLSSVSGLVCRFIWWLSASITLSAGKSRAIA